MSFGRRLRKVVSKLNCRRSSKPRTDAAPGVIQPFQSFQSRPYETPAGVGASERAQQLPPVARSRVQHVTAGSPTQAQPEPSQVHRLSAIGPDPESENRNYGESSPEEEQIVEENRRDFGLTNLGRSPSNISASSSDYSNHSISNSLSPSSPVPSVGRNLMGSHLANTPPPTPPDSGSKDSTWGEGVKECRHPPLMPQISFIQRNSTVPDELRTEEALSQLRISDDGRGNVHGQFTPQDSPTIGQMPHDISANTTFETNYSKPIARTIVRPQEIEQVTNLLDREIHTSTVHNRIQPVVAQEYLPTKHYLQIPTGDIVEMTDEQTRQGDWGEIWRGEWATNEDGSRELRTYDHEGNVVAAAAGRKSTDGTIGLLARSEESEPTEVKEFAAGPSRAPVGLSQ
ncbi:hypothetical protein L873DRAFT_1829034 [Choiromyces venosus 120613-1]|uniref:Uncharacterized protein n=1 Tax=Choiromyces venosus 120613-1 TaxID=1336337 RepID=A0A3N4JGC1_9PEZI|nr:hypothetical protein L873DRAFT_1829034 [Choiromyces venosus 120613-1]